MNEDIFNGSIRKFLKMLGVSAQREIEKAVRQALAEGKLKGNEKFSATGTITLGGIGLSHRSKARSSWNEREIPTREAAMAAFAKSWRRE